jgi:FkbM family methyltransferase
MDHNFKLTPFKYRKITNCLPSNEKYIQNVDEAKFLTGQPLNKYWTFDFIETISQYIDFNDIKTILDIGSRDGYQSVEFRTWFPESKIFAFEGNPSQFNLISEITSGYDVDIIMKSVGNFNGKTKFYISPNNIGASSLLKINDHKRSSEWPQKEIEVDIIRLDDWAKKNNVNEIDILWMDVQGVEKMVLEGLGEYLKNVKAICTEIEVEHMYHNSTLKTELDDFLLKENFVELQTFHMLPIENVTLDEIKKLQGEVDTIYINKKYLNSEKK